MMVRSVMRSLATVWLTAVILASGLASAAPPTNDTARRVVHLLDYIGVDYGATVENGAVVDEVEYREQLEFAGRVDEALTELGVPIDAPLRIDLQALREAIELRRSADEVARRSRGLAKAARERFDLHALPPRLPSPQRAKELYAQACASCHGPEGRGDGALAGTMNPPPADLSDRKRMLALSLFDLYSTISRGIDGTAMQGFAERLSEAELYDLAFLVGTIPFDPREIEEGRELLQLRPARVAELAPNLAALVERSPAEVVQDPQDLSILAFVRSQPDALAKGSLPIEVARQRLAESRQAWEQGQTRRALDLAVSAYLDGFEAVEPIMNSTAPELRQDLERRFFDHRRLLQQGAAMAAVQAAYDELDRGLEAADTHLRGGIGFAALFASALTIVTREGFEAVLIVAAIVALLTRAGRRDALRYVHAGWTGALVAGGATWLAVHSLIRVSGAQRELVEGASALLATGVLFYASFWLLSKAEAARWQEFLDRHIRAALSTGSVVTLSVVTFVAVYREALETALFFEALWAQAGAGAARPIALGVAAGTAVLVLLVAAVLYLGHRLPIPAFFAASSILLYALALVLAGQGIAAFQEAGWLPVTWVSFPRIDWLGVRPTVQGLAVQGALLALGLGALLWLVIKRLAHPQGKERLQ